MLSWTSRFDSTSKIEMVDLLGGLDSSVLAVLADQLLDQGESIDLLNVAFEQPNGSYNVPDRQTAIKAVKGFGSLTFLFHLFALFDLSLSLSFNKKKIFKYGLGQSAIQPPP